MFLRGAFVPALKRNEHDKAHSHMLKTSGYGLYE